MRRTGQCPKCASEEIGSFPGRIETAATQDPQRLQQSMLREQEIRKLELAMDRARSAGFKAEVRSLEERLQPLQREQSSIARARTEMRYACADCGYCEVYLLAPREFAKLEGSGWAPAGRSESSPYR